ncbi:MAG: zinc protease [Rhodothermales bacterium]|jgi:zinc protease
MKYLLTTLLLVVSAIPALGQTHHSRIVFPAMPNFETPSAQRVELANGMTLFLIEDRSLPMINISARIGVGSVNESTDRTGLSSILGTVMRSGGTETIPADELNERLERIAASIETGIGTTSGNASMFSLTEHVDAVLPMFADVLMNPALPQDKIDLDKTQWSSVISRRNDDPGSIAAREFDELLYGAESPWARSPEYATVDAVSREDLVAFHKAYFHPGNVIIGAWGDFDAEVMARKIEDAFSEWAEMPGFVRATPPSMEGDPAAGVYLVPKEDVTQSTVYMGHRGELTFDHPDYPAVTLMNQVLSGGFSGRLMKSVRVNQGLAYSVGGGYSANYDRPGRFFAQVMTKSESTVDATRAVIKELELMQEAPPTAEELSLARDGYLNRFVFNFDTRSEVVGRMMTYEYYDYPIDFLETQKNSLEAVTVDDVHRVAQKYLKPSDVKILAVGKPSEFGEPLSSLGPVTEIDITIPTGEEPLPKASDESTEAGRELLVAAMDAMGGAVGFEELEGVQQAGSQTIITPDGQSFDLGLKVTLGLPQRARFEQQTPGGDIVITKDGDDFGFPAMIPEQMHGQMRSQVASSLWQSPLFFLPNADVLDLQLLADAEFEGTASRVILVSPPGGVAPFRLFLNSATNMPLGISYQRGPTSIKEVFGDYRAIGAFTLPYSVTVFEGDRQAGAVAYETIDLSPVLNDGMFRQ